MAQLDVFVNPISAARRAYPFVVVLQSDVADTGRERIVAPLAPRARLSGTRGRLTPHVMVAGTEYVLFVPRLTAVAVADLRDMRDQLKSYRDEIVAALDYLFLGV
ncbi:MAG TPA: CcdB family protein [Kofleriaceae bacterium]|nr:CcdB family protein [Kofleriaceae bacterium]